MSEEVERYQAERVPPPKGLKVPEGFGYVHYKAYLYLKVGPDGYRKRDALQMPPEDWSCATLQAIEHGCRQPSTWRGISADIPLEGIGIDGFYRLVNLFHFRVVHQLLLDTDDDGFFTDEMSITHIVNGNVLTLYNRVPVQDDIDF